MSVGNVKLMKKNIKLAIKQHCKEDENYSLSKFQQWFHTVKYIICRVFRIWQKKDYADTVYVAYFNNEPYMSMDCSNAYRWDYLSVGYGYFINWFCSEGSDTNC